MSEIALREVNWLADYKNDEVIEAQYRYHGPRILGTYDAAKQVFIPSEKLTEPVAEGQSLVFYRNDVCLGGGIIS